MGIRKRIVGIFSCDIKIELSPGTIANIQDVPALLGGKRIRPWLHPIGARVILHACITNVMMEYCDDDLV